MLRVIFEAAGNRAWLCRVMSAFNVACGRWVTRRILADVINRSDAPMTTYTPILSEFLTPIELAAELRISPRTLVRWENVGDAPAITRIGRQRLYRRSSVVAWLVAREQAAAA